MEEPMFWKKKKSGIECLLCTRRCVIPKNKTSPCETRANEKGKMVLENYGKLVGLEVGKIEDRNIYHFHPDSDILSVALYNSWKLPFDDIKKSRKTMTPKDLVDFADKKGVKSIVFSGTEPTFNLEYIYRVARLAKRVNIKTLIVTNGIMTEDALKKLIKHIDGVLLHFFASGDNDFAKNYMQLKQTNHVFNVAKSIWKHHVHLEIADTIVPQVGDDPEKFRKFTQWIISNLSAEVPLHLLRFHPFGKLKNLPKTPLQELKMLANIAKSTGMRYVYVGKVKEKTELANTYCFNCRQLLIERKNGRVKHNYLRGNRCPYCGIKINVVI